ncbi:MAG: hypothetical protein Q7T11_04430, partial [Deltaproteobacteria bacterium]|nr:hypothetical protein [Deltaproteobacteria bacterium]
VPAEPAIPAQKPELLPVAAVQAVELIPGHNKNGIGRENIVFVSVEYEGDADLADAQYEEVSRKFVEATFAHAPFAGNKELFNFSIVKLPVKLKRTEADMCFGSAPDLAALSQEVAAKTGLPNVQIVNLLATDCRSQASWFDFTSGENIYREFAANMDWEKLIAKFSDPETQRELASDASAVYRMISDAADMEEIARKIFPLFEAPIANVSLEVSPRNSVVSNHIPWVGVHEFGHSFGRLWDLYSEAGTDGFAEIIQDLNRERSLADLLKQYAGVDLPFLSGIRFNLFKLLARHPAIEKVIGEKIGEPHCAITKEEAREWWGPFKGEGEGDQQVTFDELGWNEGCLYMTDQFFRSSKASRMRQSHSADSRFDPVEIAHIQKRLDAIRERMRKIQAQK